MANRHRYLVSEIKRVNHLSPSSLARDLHDAVQGAEPRRAEADGRANPRGHGADARSTPAGTSHPRALSGDEDAPLRTLPVQFYAFPEGIFIVGGDEENRDLVGCEVVKIEETPPAEVLRRIEEHASVETR